ncbi:phage tail tape measure protein, partial [Pseudophaeobacter arcticus]
MAIIGSLRGLLSLESTAFESGAKRGIAAMGNVERRMVRLGNTVERQGRRLALGLTVPMVGAAALAVKSSLKIVDAQAKMAQSLGTTVQSMQVLERAADLSGVSIGEVEQATIQLTKRLSQAAA